MIKINVIVKDKTWLKFIKNPKIYLQRKLKKIQNDNFFEKNKYSISILLSSSNEIKNLNKKFRKINKVTDILSFPNQTKNNLNILKKRNIEIYLGDIIINFKKMNTSSKSKFKKHFDILWVHGLVHLFNYDHKKEIDYKIMNSIERKFIKKLN